MPSVYVIEDDPQIRELVVAALANAGFVARASGQGMIGLTEIIEHAPDVVIIDLGLPDIDGADLLPMLRAVSDVPVIVATARDEEQSIIALLDAGADEYVVKPYSGNELVARVRALLRRIGAAGPVRTLSVGEIEIDLRSRIITLGGNEVVCTRKEFDLLAYLATQPGEVVAREDLYAEVWRQPYGGADKTIDVHISWLRRKLGETAAEPRYLHTVRGVGVRLVDPT